MNLEKPDLKTLPKGTKLITRNGKDVSEWHYFETYDSDYPVVAIVENQRYVYCRNGEYERPRTIDDLDLFIAPNVKEIWVNLYKSIDGKVIYTGQDFNTEAEALKHKGSACYVKTIKITDEI